MGSADVPSDDANDAATRYAQRCPEMATHVSNERAMLRWMGKKKASGFLTGWLD